MNNFYSCDVLGENVFNFTDYYGRMNMYDLKNFTASFNFSYTENLNITNCSFKK